MAPIVGMTDEANLIGSNKPILPPLCHIVTWYHPTFEKTSPSPHAGDVNIEDNQNIFPVGT